MTALNEAGERFRDILIVTNMIAGTDDALGNDPALTALASFVNGVRIALIDPALARRLSDAAEFMVTRSDPSGDDGPFLGIVEAANRAYAELGS